MKRFILKTAIVMVMVMTTVSAIILTADGTIDPFYLRFTTPMKSSLIIGTSRAAQTFQPRILNAALRGSEFDLPIFNFGFTLTRSPYGPVYLNAILKKLRPGTKDGLFILAVDPWSLSSRSKRPNDTSTFIENDKVLGTLNDINGTHPHIDYFFNLDKGLGKLVTARIEYWFTKSKRLHKDGWLEITVPMDAKSIAKRMKKKLAQFNRNINVFRFSSKRFEYFEKTVSTLKENGTVVLVRLPAAPKLLEIENRLVPNFDQIIQGVAKEYDVLFIDYTRIDGPYNYTDGSHIHKSSGSQISHDIARRILDREAPMRSVSR